MKDEIGKMEKMFESYEEDMKGIWDSSTTTKYKRLVFFMDEVVDITTYDDDISYEFGKETLEVMKVIYNKNNFKYIADNQKYINYLRAVNNIITWVEWGTSIRGAWFNYCDGYIDINGSKLQLSEEFMNWFIKWLDGKTI